MSEQGPGELEIENAKRRGLRGLSPVWLVPILAIGIALFMVWDTFSRRGPLIDITFESAQGVVANTTVLKYRNVDIGKVERIHFSPDLRNVIVSVRLDKDIAPYADSDALFWIVSPEISAQGISGLTTLLGGVFLEASFDENPGQFQESFKGLTSPPLITGNEKGIEFTLTAPNAGTVQAGAPIIYKGVAVGLIDRPVLSADGRIISARAFVRAPYDRLVNTSSQFWGASGVRVDLGPGGVKVDIASLGALIQGGVEFETSLEKGQPVQPGHVFEVHANRDAANSSQTIEMEGPAVPYAAVFEGSVEGLSIGAPVQYNGLTIGTVSGTEGQVVESGADTDVEVRVDLRMVPARLGIETDEPADDTRALFEALVAEGWRIRLASQGLLGTSLKVELVKVEDAPEAKLTALPDGVLVLPATERSVSDVTETAKSTLARFQSLPFERIANSVATLLDNVNAVVASPSVRDAPSQVVGLAQDLRAIVGSDQVKGAVAGASASLADLSQILAELEKGGAVANLVATIDSAAEISKSLESTAASLPQLSDQLNALAAKATQLPLDQLIAEAQGILVAARGIAEAPAMQGLPAQVSATMDELTKAVTNVTAITTRVNEGTALTNLLAALDQTKSIANSIDQTAQGLPALVDRINAVAAEAQALPLDQVVTSANELVQSANALVSSPDTAKIPAALASSLDQLGQALAELREGGAVANVNTTLASASNAADAIAKAADRLPELAAKLDGLVSQTETVMATYDDRSQFNTQTIAALRDLSLAARAVTSLAQTIERKPNSLLIGR